MSPNPLMWHMSVDVDDAGLGDDELVFWKAFME